MNIDKYGQFRTDFIEKWVNLGKLAEYMQNRYREYKIHQYGSTVEVFIGDEEIDDLDEPGFEDSFYIVDQALEDLGYSDNGEVIYYTEELTTYGILLVAPLSDMVSSS